MRAHRVLDSGVELGPWPFYLAELVVYRKNGRLAVRRSGIGRQRAIERSPFLVVELLLRISQINQLTQDRRHEHDFRR